MWNGTTDQIEIVMIRHGKTKSNMEHRYLGKTEEGLSLEGIQELEERKQRGGYPPCDWIYGSPMKRCMETAELLYGNQQMIQIPEWEEMDFGEFEGKNYEDLKENAIYQNWIDHQGRLPFPGGECREDFVVRCEKGFQKVVKDVLEKTKERPVQRIGFVVHGGTIMALLSQAFEGEYFDYQVKNGEGYFCNARWEGEQLKMIEKRKIE